MHSLVRRQLRKAFPDGALSPQIAAFAELVSDAYLAADEDRRQLERSIEIASTELHEHNHAMALILDNVAQGFVIVGFDGVIQRGSSRTLARWFGPTTPDVPIWSYLLGHVPDLAGWMQLGFESLASALMPVEVVVAQLPGAIERHGRQLRIAYRPVGSPAAALLIVVSDDTDELARGEAEAAQREVIALVAVAAQDRNAFFRFVRDTDALLARCAIAASNVDETRRATHTLKGNFAMFGLPSMATRCHALETALEDGEGTATVAHLSAAWDALRDQVDALLGSTTTRTIVVGWDAYQAVLAELADQRTPWATAIRRWGQDPTRAHLERLAEFARRLALQVDRAALDVEVLHHDAAVEADRFAPLWAALVHTVHNAIDHGLESPDARDAAGKPVRAQLTLMTEICNAQLVVEIADDGAGVDWEAVAVRARSRGLAANEPSELAEALFVDGLSTASELTTTSGRGVGLGALRTICRELGGDVEIVGMRGRGTTVRCVVPVTRSRSFTRCMETIR